MLETCPREVVHLLHLDKLWPPIQSELCVQIDEIYEHDGVRVTVSNLYREFTLHVC